MMMTLPAAAQVYVRIAPPAPIVETIPRAPGAGYVWQGGYYRWDGSRYVWTHGHYVRATGNYHHWCAGRWVAGPRGYHWTEGRWC
jgi:hypothetical protein